MVYVIQIGLLIVSYLLGSIPWGFLFGKMKGIDIREHGSKNIGTTNTGRVLGFRYAIYTYILDMLKGAIIIALFRFNIIPMKYCLFNDPLFYGLAAVLGHTFSIFLKFRGGKAVATSGGLILGYCPWLLLVGLLVFFLVVYLTNYVSVGSLVATSTAFIITVILAFLQKDPFFPKLTYNYYFPIFTAIILSIIIIRHKSNIERLRTKKESKVSWGRKRSKID